MAAKKILSKIGFNSYLYGTDWKLQEITKVQRTEYMVRRTFSLFLIKGPSDDENVAHL